MSFKAKAYLLSECPFCFKFLLFMTEAKLLDQIQIVRIDPRADDFESVKSRLAAATSAKVTFPTVEIKPDIYLSDSDKLIDFYRGEAGIETAKLPTLQFYVAGLLPAYVNLYKENIGLKQKPTVQPVSNSSFSRLAAGSG